MDRLRLAVVPAMVMAVLIGAGGCETITSDFGEVFIEPFTRPSPGEAARAMFDQNDASERRLGVTLLADSPFGGGEVYVTAYADRVEFDTDPIVRAASVRALARHGGPEHAPLIADQLIDDSFQVRWEAAKGLQRLHDPQVVGVLLAVLRREGEDPDVRSAAAFALGQYREERVFQGLVAALGVRELSVNLNAQESLVTLTGQDFGLDDRSWLTWRNDTDEPFIGARTYVFKTYTREDTFMEKIAFWSRKTWESPAPPAGLRPDDLDQTYPDDEPPAEGDGSAEG